MSDRALRVLIIPSWYFKPGTNSIAGILFFHHALELRKRGLDAQIAYAGYSGKCWYPSRSSYMIEQGVPTWRGEGWALPKVNATLIKMWVRKSAGAILRHLKAGHLPDVIHAQGYQAAWIAEYIRQEASIPYIVTEHYSGFLRQVIPHNHHPFIRSAFDHAKVVTAVSPGLRDEIQPFTNTSILVIPNYYNPEMFFPGTHRPSLTPFQWLSVGEPIHTKGLDVLLEAFGQVVQSRPQRQFRMVLADKIPQQDRLEEMARRLGIAGNIEFRGLLEPHDLALLMQSSHVLVSASRFETFGKTMVEANACGIPVVATRTAGAAFIMQSAKQGFLCEPGSPESLTSAMLQMVDQYDTFDAGEIHHAVVSRFHRDEIIGQWINLYNQCVYDS